MLWDKLTEENYIIYVNRDIDLKIKEQLLFMELDKEQ